MRSGRRETVVIKKCHVHDCATGFLGPGLTGKSYDHLSPKVHPLTYAEPSQLQCNSTSEARRTRIRSEQSTNLSLSLQIRLKEKKEAIQQLHLNTTSEIMATPAAASKKQQGRLSRHLKIQASNC